MFYILYTSLKPTKYTNIKNIKYTYTKAYVPCSRRAKESLLDDVGRVNAGRYSPSVQAMISRGKLEGRAGMELLLNTSDVNTVSLSTTTWTHVAYT